MGGVTSENNGSAFEMETVNGEPNKEFVLGEILWVKLRESSWWPAQIVDENLVSSANKPSSKGSSSDVLVRLYGSCILKFVDAHGSHAEFKKILIENNFNYDDILKKSLEQDLPSMSSSKSRKRQQSKSKGSKDVSDKSQTKGSSKKQKQVKPKTSDSHPQTPDGVHHGTEPTTLNKGLTARRMKVMQNLGLVAPSGSPFPRSPTLSN
ncbi:uncharacterized protein [Rutidosis leptorrhynchoides]|uniref:uncharacterized protein isoform X2 n=1 Tax=Rutidosis leptorrhynchoides TaxID=125765 RepID=UPI003A9959FD